MKSNGKKVKAYIRHVLPVFLAACLVAVALIPVYITTKQQASARVTQALDAQLERGLSSVNRKIDMLRTLIFGFVNETDTLSLALLTDEQLAASNYLALYHMKGRLDTLSNLDLLGEHLIVQFRNSSAMLVDGKLMDDKHSAYGTFIEYPGMEFEEYQARVFSGTQSFWPAALTSLPAKSTYELRITSEEYITLNLFFRLRLANSVIASILIPAERIFEEIVPDYAREGSLFLLLDATGTTLYDSASGAGAALLAETGETMRLNGEEYVLFRSSQGTGLYACVAVPQRIMYADVTQVMNMIYLFIVIALACAALYCAVYAYIYFRPMLSLMDRLSAMGYGKNDSGRFYDSLQTAIASLNSDREQLRRQMDDADKRVDQYVLQRAASGASLTASELGILEKRSVFSDRFIVVILEYRNREAEERRALLVKASALMLFQPETESVMEENRLFCIYAYRNGHIAGDLDAVFGVLAQHAERRINMVCSAVHEDVSELPKAVQEAEETLLRARMAVRPVVTWFEEAAPQEESGAMIPFQRYTDLTASLASGDKAAAQEIIEGFRKAMESAALSPERMARALGNLRDAVLLAASRLGETLPAPTVREQEAPYRALEEISGWAALLCDSADRRRENRHDEQMQQIMEYIRQNHTNPDFGLVNVAEEFNLSEKYISRLIKKHTGANYSTHIEALRMEHARQLLTTSRLTVEEITAAVGYEHANTFYKAFKRYFGCVPNELRKEQST